MRPCCRWLAALTMALAGGGCAHHQQNQYAYAPPLAPPVYPQPQSPTPAMAAMAAAPPMTGGPMVAAPPGTVLPPGAVVAAPAAGMPGAVDPCCNPVEGGAIPVVYESAGQTPPCPPGP
jgi:hypothetical protein